MENKAVAAARERVASSPPRVPESARGPLPLLPEWFLNVFLKSDVFLMPFIESEVFYRASASEHRCL